MWRRGGQYAYSQNSIHSPLLVKRLLSKSRISYSDTLIEIGAGNGIITKELTKRCKEVIAYEIDQILFKRLEYNLRDVDNVKLINDDFLKSPLPVYDYKVFSNIPFNITSRILNKLFMSPSPPVLSYLIMQKEAAEWLIGFPRETQKSLLFKPFYKINLRGNLRRSDFTPRPRVNAAFIEIERLQKPALTNDSYKEYRDFIVYGTTQWKATISESLKNLLTLEQLKRLSSDLGFSLVSAPLGLTYFQWLGIYNYLHNSVVDVKKERVKGYYLRQLSKQRKLKKIYRTRSIS